MPVDPSSADGDDQELKTQAGDPGTTEISGTPDVSTQGAEDDQNAAISSTADGTPSEIEGEEGAKEPESMVEALEKALEQDKQAAESPPASSEDQKSEDKPDPAKEAAKEGEKPEDGDDKPPPFHEHPRWKQVMAERSELKGQNAELTTQVEKLTEAGEAIDRLEGYLRTNNLTTDEHNTLLHIGALMRNDPAKALEALTPYYSALLEITGTILPTDIQQGVSEGLITEAYGRELAQRRAGEHIAGQKLEMQSSQHDVSTQDQFVEVLSTEASAWEKTWAASDPDYEKKAELVNDGIKLRLLGGDIPNGAEAVVKMCEEERSKVEARMRAFIPKVAITPSPGSSGGPSSSAPSAPTSMLEAMEQSIAGAYE